MNGKRVLILFCAFILLYVPSLWAAPALPAKVRVLLLGSSQARQQLSLADTASVSASVQGQLIWQGAFQEGVLRRAAGSFWQLSGSYASYDEAVEQAGARLGGHLPWLPVYDGYWRVWVGDPLGESIGESRLYQSYPNLSFTQVMPTQQCFYLADGEQVLWLYAHAQPLQLQGDPSLAVTEKGHRYAGILEISCSGGGFGLINEVDLESYVAGSLSKEMSPAWPLEALKAQAVAIRTVIAGKTQTEAARGEYHVNDSELSYIGYDRVEQGAVRRAVEETAGQVLCYQGSLIQAVFHADSGGHTQNSEDVWSNELPYLRATPELFASEGPDAVWSPSPSFTGEELRRMLVEAGHDDIGTVRQVINEEMTSFGAALKMLFIGSKGEVSLEMGQIRTALQLKSNNLMARPASQVLVRSKFSLMPLAEQTQYLKTAQETTVAEDIAALHVRTATLISKLPSTAASSDRFVFSGGGWGHGVGLSQWGAKAMADKGYDYKAILSHYYRGVSMERG